MPQRATSLGPQEAEGHGIVASAAIPAAIPPSQETGTSDLVSTPDPGRTNMGVQAETGPSGSRDPDHSAPCIGH